LDKTLSRITDAMGTVTESIGKISKRMDGYDDERRRDASRRDMRRAAAVRDGDEGDRDIEEMAQRTAADDADARADLVDAQIKADAVANLFGEKAPAPLSGETALIYRHRLARQFKQHSKDFKDVDLATVNGKAFDAAESVIYNDAIAAGKAPPTVQEGRLIPRTRRMDSGHTITEFFGDSRAWMYPFMGPTRQYVNGRFDDSSLRNTRR
jgi:hypothetical protein